MPSNNEIWNLQIFNVTVELLISRTSSLSKLIHYVFVMEKYSRTNIKIFKFSLTVNIHMKDTISFT